MSAHAVLSPSSAHRWMRCPGSVRVEAEVRRLRYAELLADAQARGLIAVVSITNEGRPADPETTIQELIDAGIVADPFGSHYADEGTRAHAVAERCLARCRVQPDVAGEMFASDSAPTFLQHCDAVCTEAAATSFGAPEREAILHFVRSCLSIARGAVWWSEERRVTVNSRTWGTSDFTAVHCNEAGGYDLTICDLKFGVGEPVSVQDNEQLLAYAAGALLDLSPAFPDLALGKVTVGIHQPRLRAPDWVVVPAQQVLDWATGRLIPAQASTDSPDAPLVPGEKQCRWCVAAKSGCKARARAATELALTGFAPAPPLGAPTVRSSELLSNDEVAAWIPLIPLIRQFCKDFDEDAIGRALRGQRIPGFKLVQGRPGNRAWTNEALVDAALARRGGLKIDDRAPRSLVSPAAAEKLLGRKKFPDVVGALVTQPPGKPTLVPESDPREPIRTEATAGFAPEPTVEIEE